MKGAMELLLELLLEFILQLIFELLSLILDDRFVSRRTYNAAVKGTIYGAMGVLCGYLSYLAVPYTLTGAPPSALASIVFIPLMAAGLCTIVARRCSEHWKIETGMVRFSYSLILAWSFSVARFLLLQWG